MKQHGRNVWVVCHNGQFTVKEQRARQPLIAPAPQYTAIAIGRRRARHNNSELIIQGKDGRIRARDSHGFDDFPPRG
jgi:hypothetical protein